MPVFGFPFAAVFGDPDALTADEAATRAWLLSLWPPGVTELYDFANEESGPSLYLNALAKAFQLYGVGREEDLRDETLASTATAKLAEWEAALGIGYSVTAQLGSTAARRAAVVSRLREFGSYDRPAVRAIVGPLLGYADPTQMVVLECDRAALRTAQELVDSTVGAIPGGGSATRTFTQLDAGAVSAAGVEVNIKITHAAVDVLGVNITGPAGPDGQAQVFRTPGVLGSGAAVAAWYTVRGLAAAGKTFSGVWTVEVYSTGAAGTLHETKLFVEAAGRTGVFDGRGSEVYEWGVVKDGSLAGIASPADDAAARAALARIKPAHTNADLIYLSGDASGAAIPDDPEAIPDACYPGA